MEDIVKATLSEQIYKVLKEDIISQSIKCGEKLTIKALQERFKLSSTPIREAMKRLGSEGLIDDVTNVGAKVIILEKKDVSEIYDLCLILDSAALELSLNSKNINEFTFELTNCVKMQKEALDLENIKDFKIYSDDFHDIFFRFADNSRLYDASIRIRSQLSILTNKYQNFEIAESVVFIEHKNITDAVLNKDFEKAKELLIKHFSNGKNYMLNNIKL